MQYVEVVRGVGEYEVTAQLQLGQFVLRSAGRSPVTGLDEYQRQPRRYRLIAGHKDGGVHGRVERIALAQTAQMSRLQPLPHPLLALQGEKRVRDDEADETARPQQGKP